MSLLADRHYSRRKVGARQFLPPGKTIVLRNAEATVLFAWHWANEVLRMDGQKGYCCSIFRNESELLSSALILEAEVFAFDIWGHNRVFTYVDGRKIRSTNPGCCFKAAGYSFVRVSTTGLHLLAKVP